jgi:hypothetical protein
MSIDFTAPEEQHLTLALVRSGDLRYVDAHRLCFPGDKATLENIELREIFDNARFLQGPYVARREA